MALLHRKGWQHKARFGTAEFAGADGAAGPTGAAASAAATIGLMLESTAPSGLWAAGVGFVMLQVSAVSMHEGGKAIGGGNACGGGIR